MLRGWNIAYTNRFIVERAKHRRVQRKEDRIGSSGIRRYRSKTEEVRRTRSPMRTIRVNPFIMGQDTRVDKNRSIIRRFRFRRYRKSNKDIIPKGKNIFAMKSFE